MMTRQNQIPTEDGSRVTLALIPLWDMCNHTNGLVMPSSALGSIGGTAVVKLKSGHSPCKPSSPLIASCRGSRHPSRCRQAEAGISLCCVYLIPQTGNSTLTSLLKTTVNCMYLLGHNSSLHIHFLILLNHRLNQVSLFLFFLKY